MAEMVAKRVGRPRTRASETAGDYVGFRASRDLKQRLEAAAKASGRSLSTEAQFRLERSFDRESLFPDSLKLAFGPGLSGMLFMLGRVMSESGRSALFQKSNGAPASAGWLADPFAYAEAVAAAIKVLEEFRPEGDAQPRNIGARFATARIFEVVNEGGPYPFGEREWIDLARSLLGPDLIAQSKRLREGAQEEDEITAPSEQNTGEK
ncbi:MAG: TraY domain-containing protein [Alphaproteobacteria bacterium]|nr:TraY domain-containing protein [Alphaproteobacteria bacterium]